MLISNRKLFWRLALFTLVCFGLGFDAARSQQSQPDPATLQRAVSVMQAQRNQASDEVAEARVRILALADELAKAHARVKELEAEPKK